MTICLKPTQQEQEIVYAFDKQYQQPDPFWQGKVMSYPVPTEDIKGEQRGELEYICKPTFLDYVDVQFMWDILLKPISVYEQLNSKTEDVYFSHSDHLGSANWITDGWGNPIQYIHYAPYGELIDNQHASGSWYDERYKFTGKERDAETGYYAFGARYWWLAGTWLSVDPLSDKYPQISPYAYCGWNPVKFVDPDGRDAILITFPNYKAEYKGLHLPYTGHSGVLLINTKTGLTKYYEYGRYDGKMGRARNIKIPNVKIKDGKPILKSLNEVLKSISNNSGRNGNIEGAYIESDDFESMMNYAEGVCAEADNPEREPYNIFNNNCATFAEDVITQDESIDKPIIILPTPVNVVEEYQKNGNAKVVYNSETQETSLER